MTELFSGASFDDFKVNKITIINGPSTVIEGCIFDDEGKEDFCLYSAVKKIAYECVKGKVLPKFMKFVLIAPEKLLQEQAFLQEQRLNDGESLSITISFKDNELSVMSGAYLKDPFSSRETEKAWDETAGKMFLPFI